MTGEPIPNTHGLEHPIRVVPPKPRGTGRVWYRPNHRSFGAFMRSDQMRDVTEEVARDIARTASASIEPSDTPDGLRSRVKRGFTVKRNAGLLKVSGNLRVRVLVENKADGSAILEFGGRNLKGRRMLGNAGARFGDFHTWREDG